MLEKGFGVVRIMVADLGLVLGVVSIAMASNGGGENRR